MPLALGMLAFDDLGMILRLHEIFLAKSSWYVSASLQCKQTNLYSKKKKKITLFSPAIPCPALSYVEMVFSLLVYIFFI